MASVNKVILVGNLGADPEVRYSQSGNAICNLRVATTESWKDKSTGEKKENTEWHRVLMYRGLAKLAERYLKKGSQVYIEGRIRTRKWQDKSGADHYTTEIEADEMMMLGEKSNTTLRESSATKANGAWVDDFSDAKAEKAPDWLEDKIPF